MKTAVSTIKGSDAGWYDRLYGRVGFRLGQWALRQPTPRLLEEMLKQQYLSPSSLAGLQLEKLDRLLKHAARSVPFYRETLGRPNSENRLKSLEEFRARVPLLDKKMIRANPAAFVAEGAGERLRRVRSGGSTGEPLVFYSTPTIAAHTLAQMIRARGWWGINPGSRGVVFWGNSASFRQGLRGRVAKQLKPLKDRAANRLSFSAYDMSHASMAVYASQLAAFRPEFILGYASTLYVFAKYLREQKRDAKREGLRVVISTSETLHDWQRELIEEVFDCPVANEYGLSEVGVVAYECPARSLHIFDDNLLVETIPLTGADELYEIVVTPLYNLVAPLIRYRTGDIVAEPIRRSDCACGIGLSVMGAVRGRSHDLIVTSEGKYIHGELFTHIFEHVRGVDRFQVIQESSDRFVIKIVKGAGYAPEQEQIISSQIHEHVGANARTDFEYCEQIEVEASGKYRWIKSSIAPRDI